MTELPLGLRHALEANECVLFIGSGIGCYLKNSVGETAPDGFSLAKELASYFNINYSDEYNLAKISKIVEIRKGRAELIAFLRTRLADLQPDENIQWLCSLRWKAIFTTNYDRGIQRAYELSSKPRQNFKTITTTSEIVPFDKRFDVPIYHLHGALFESENPQIIITEDDYSIFKERRRMLFELLKKEFITSSILYIGYSNQDSNWNIILNEIASEFYPTPMPTSYRIAPDTDQIEREILENKNIFTIDMNFEEFVGLASACLCVSEAESENIMKFQSKVPSDLLTAFEKNPTSVTRLLNSWAYINQAAFNEAPNIELFLRGDRPNWALIGSGHYFERDIEEQIFDDLLDYATSSTKTANARIILAPAGYGISTLLMTLAVKLITERAGPVFMLKPGCSLLEGDVEFAATIFDTQPFFFVDNAVDNTINLKTIIQRFKETKTTGMFLLGERLNEWRQSSGAFRSKEFQIDPLSDPEIERLLDFLGEHSALNKLEGLSRELQISAIKKNYLKELLVAMREATEGNDFDAILEDEFRGIGDRTSRLAYLIVSCFYQHGTYIRDSLLADLLNINIAELHELTSRATEGVILYDSIDESKGIYGARTRHRTIASVVWERCGLPAEKDQIIKDSLNCLNLNYGTDAKAFESFYRSDRLVDSIGTLDGKIQFFEKACKKDPESPYVRQHYSRMLIREKKSELALSQINSAIELDKKIRVLYHTKGLILSKIALEIDSLDLARRRLIQSESSFRKGINLAPKDPHSYQGLSQAYLGWAARCQTSAEAADYISKAEAAINDGLKNTRVRDGLWIESANIQKFLGDNPGHLKALEKAVQETPGSIIARYLLGKTYRKECRFQDAADILKPIILNHPDEVRSFVEYTLALYNLGKPYIECIAILQQSTLYGYSDPRFIATLGGMLFMNGHFSKADKVFEESIKRDFTASELNTIQFRPLDPVKRTSRHRIKGYVIIVKAGYALIESTGYPKPFLCPGSKFKGILMKNGLNLTFEPAFNAKGAVADNPRID